MTTGELTDDEIDIFMNPLLSGQAHPLMKKMMAVIQDTPFERADMSRFFGPQTNFSGVCRLLKKLKRHITDEGGTAFGLPNHREEVILKNGKSDIITKKYLQMCQKYCDKKEFDSAMRMANRAYFSAFSEEAKYSALQKRCYILLQIEYYEEFLRDAISCLEINSSPKKKKVIYLLIAKFYNEINYPGKGKVYSEKAYKPELNAEEIEGDVEALMIEISKVSNNKAKWMCIHSEPPESLYKLSKNIFESNEEKLKRDPTKIKTQLLSAKDNLIQLTDTKSHRGWALKATEQVPLGEVILAEKPYAAVLSSQFTRYCYCCFRRCINIIPCEGCAMVGFCSEKCAKDARSPTGRGPGRHIYDCGGLLPFLRIDALAKTARPEQIALSHLAYTCIANTPAETLLNRLCSTGPYKHQAFKESLDPRGNPPTFLNPSDYSAVASAYVKSEGLGYFYTNDYDAAAIFLTYCLWLAGYPMKWFDEAEGYFYRNPTTLTKRPDFLPASWVAACMVYHMKAARFNATKYREVLESTKTGASNDNLLGYCIYPTISFINHDCNPNACIAFTANGGAYIYTIRPIQPGEEITISYQYHYFSPISATYRRQELVARYSFECNCTACIEYWIPRRRIEILRCSVCKWRYLSIDKECGKEGCKKDRGYELYQSISAERLPHITSRLTSNNCQLEDVVEALALLKQTQELYVSPSQTVATVTDTCIRLIDRVTGIKTREYI